MKKAYRIKRVGLLAVMIAVYMGSVSTMAYANTAQNGKTTEDQQVNTDKYSLTPSEVYEGRTWDRKPGGWRYLDIDGNAITGHFFDNNGDFYYAKENGYIVMNDVDEYGQYYDSQGRLYNFGYTKGSSEYNKLSEQLERGNNVYFPTSDEFHEFIEYYGKVYNLESQNLSFKRYQKRKTENGKLIKEEYFINNASNKRYDRKAMLEMLEKKVPEELVGESVAEKINSMCDIVRTKLKYNENKLMVSLEESLTTSEGGCWHFVKLAQALLTREGIPHEIVTGTAYGVPHIWLRIKDENGRWIYCDPTLSANVFAGYSDIDYRVYMDNYRVYRFFG